MGERFELQGVTHERPRQRLFVGLGAFAFCALICLAVGAFNGPFAFLVTFLLSIVGAPRIASSLAGTRTAAACEAVLENGVLEIPAIGLRVKPGEIREGIESGSDGSVVLDLIDEEILRLSFAGGREPAERLLTAYGVSAEQRTATVPLRRQLGRFTIGLLTLFFGMLPSSILGATLTRLLFREPRPDVTWLLAMGLAFLLTWIVVRRLGSPRVIIGADGLQIRGMLSQPFIRYSEIKHVRQLGWYIVLDLENGKERTLPIIAVDQDRVSGLVQRIERARRLASDGRSFLTDSLARAGRTLVEWRAALEGLAKREATFREAPLDRDEVSRIATDPNADAEQRVGAAFVLTRIDADVGKQRIRVAADATADDALRSALLAAAEGEMESEAIERLAKKM